MREAKRAALRKDYDSARKVAQTVIDAWGVADVPVPNVAEMKALIASLPPPAEREVPGRSLRLCNAGMAPSSRARPVGLV